MGRGVMRELRWLVVLLCVMLEPPPAAAEPYGKLASRPDPAALLSYAPGVTELGNDALLYRPSNLGQPPYPMIVGVHGFTGSAEQFLTWLQPIAEEEGALLLAVQSRGERWDLVPDPKRHLTRRSRPTFGRDVPRIDEVLTAVFTGAPVDPARIAIVGFSDGGSYALSLGLANYELFTSVIGLSPGFVRVPAEVLPSQRVLVASGKADAVLPYDVVELKIVPLLVESGFRPRFCTFEGGHVVHVRMLRDAVGYAFGRDLLPPERTRTFRRPYECSPAGAAVGSAPKR